MNNFKTPCKRLMNETRMNEKHIPLVYVKKKEATVIWIKINFLCQKAVVSLIGALGPQGLTLISPT